MKTIFVKSKKEVGSLLFVKYSNGTTKCFDAVELAVNWLSMSNDAFYDIYGFNYIPSQIIQSIARTRINTNYGEREK